MKKLFSNIKRKLHSRKGESFVELLIAIIIVAFGCVIVATSYSSTLQIQTSVNKSDSEYYDSLSDLENMNNSNNDNIKVQIVDEKGNAMTRDIDELDSYGDDVIAYKKNK